MLGVGELIYALDRKFFFRRVVSLGGRLFPLVGLLRLALFDLATESAGDHGKPPLRLPQACSAENTLNCVIAVCIRHSSDDCDRYYAQ